MRMRIGGPLLRVLVSLVIVSSTSAATFSDFFSAVWAPENIIPNDTTRSVALRLTQTAGAQFTTRDQYLFGSFVARIKLVPGESSGTVSTLYMTSYGEKHDEIDYEFLGNETGNPYIVHTNVFANGVGGREQQIYLWFDPTADFHDYAIVWNHHQITWAVDGIPIRVYKNVESRVPNSYPRAQGQVVAHSIFEASSWATRGGAVPTKWEKAPFVVRYEGFRYEGCKVVGNATAACLSNYERNWWEAREHRTLNAEKASKLKEVRQRYQVYDYCQDRKRYPAVPPECAYNTA